MRTQRNLVAVAAALALGATGCHHHTVVYQPPPPPTPQQQQARGARPTPATNAARNTPPAPIVRVPPPVAEIPHAPIESGRILSTETGTASWYGPPYDHRAAADGSIFDQNAMTAAHRTLPLGTMVRVTNLSTGLSANVRITDRGPFVQGRIVDLSLAAAKATGLYRMGIAKVKLDVYSVPANADPEGRWCVQIGSFARHDDALKLKAELLRRYADAKVIDFPSPVGGYWVRITSARPDRTHSAQIANNIHPVDPAASPYLVRTN